MAVLVCNVTLAHNIQDNYLPAPLGPKSEKHSDFWIEKETLSTAVLLPKDLVRWRTRRAESGDFSTRCTSDMIAASWPEARPSMSCDCLLERCMKERVGRPPASHQIKNAMRTMNWMIR